METVVRGSAMPLKKPLTWKTSGEEMSVMRILWKQVSKILFQQLLF